MKKTFALAALLLLGIGVYADEGMWPLDNFPQAQVKEKYGVNIDSDWLRTAQLATARLGGCTGSFASPDGLVLTNNHCVWGCVRDLSSEDRNLSDTGFNAGSKEDELICPGQQISVLMDYEEVTDKISKATEGLSDADANDARKKTLTSLEETCEEDSKLKCEAVNLYRGGQYFIYKYKRYDDVRLVFAPELDIAAFGGDPDNFNFPRWCLDMSFLRVYEDGRPASTPNFLRWNSSGPEAEEPVFITGHPGSTQRQLTLSELSHLQTQVIPIWLLRYSELRGRMLQWQNTSDEAARVVQQRILGLENGIKVRRNELFSLMNQEKMAEKAAEEAALKAAVAADPELQAKYGDAWDEVDKAMSVYSDIYVEYLFVEQAAAFNSTLFDYARNLVRLAAEREKPNVERLREFRETALPRLQQSTLAATPVNMDYEKLRLTFSLEKLLEWLGPDSAYVKTVLGNDSAKKKAGFLVDNSQLADAEYRKTLWEGGMGAIKASDDAMIQLALAVDGKARAIRKRYEDEVQAVRDRGKEKIAAARFAVKGTDIYPDATFTLRVTYGSVVGWEEQGEMLQPFTRTARLYERNTGSDPFKLPESWLSSKDVLDMKTPFNFVATTDITGGNSGSPVVDQYGNLVGLAFDGNIHSIAGNYWFDETRNRTVAVNTAIMLEALKRVYKADHLLEELTLTE